MFSKIKAIQDLKSQANQIKKALEGETAEGTGAWGKVKITIDGNQEVKAVEISAEIIGDKAKLEAGVKEAVNDAIKKVQRIMAKKMSEMGGLNIPGLGGK
jgi:DNA-binding YbaB/EbfC family protein